MSLLQLFVLSIVQGITEFLPISSSGHLILVPHFTDWEDQGLLLDVAVHIGSLIAVLLYFWRDIWQMSRDTILYPKIGSTLHNKLAIFVVIATLPVIFVGFLMKDYIGSSLRSMEVIGWMMLVFGIILYLSDRYYPTHKTLTDLKLPAALYIGIAQVIALIPGTSRSGITMTAGRILGFSRIDAARFSMLLAIPTTLGAGVLGGYDIYQSGDAVLLHDAFIAAAFSFVAAFLCIAFLMRWLVKCSFTIFAVYRVFLGAVLLLLVYV